jgi:hypothetical protein
MTQHRYACCPGESATLVVATRYVRVGCGLWLWLFGRFVAPRAWLFPWTRLASLGEFGRNDTRQRKRQRPSYSRAYSSSDQVDLFNIIHT